jgi:hypothetical protein
MKRKIAGFLFIMAFLLSATGLTLVNLATADPIPAPPILEVYIRSDGTVDPSIAPIQRTGNIYTFTSDLTNSTIIVQRDNIVIDGAGFKLQGNGPIWNTGITLTNRRNVIIKNLYITDYSDSISLTASSNIIIYRNNMLTAGNIVLDSSVGNQIVGNNIVGQETGYGYCVHIENGAANNLIIGNNFSDAGVAVTIYSSSGKNNTFYHNNFFDNSYNVAGWIDDEEANSWDNGEEGNYWSDYQGINTNGDGIGDTPYIIDDNRSDRYPLMVPFDVDSVTVELPEWASPLSVRLISPKNATCTSANVTLEFTVNKEISWMGYSLDGQETVAITGNITLTGLSNGLHNVTVYAKDELENIWNSETISFTVEVPEPFPTATVAAVSGASAVVVVGAVLAIYFKKRNRQAENHSVKKT